jgi:alpha-L-arabinofuranosidase
MGHPEPFNLKMIGIGNEQWGEVFPIHLELFTQALNEKHPDILVIGSSGPQASGEQFDYLWKENARIKVDLVDEHYYRPPDWFLENATRYDSYNRDWPAVFAGEYACYHQPEKKNSFYSALCEAAFLTGIERNADIVHLATYAPLFAHVDAWQWKPDMIWYDNLRSVKSANYYVQQLYSHYKGTTVFIPTLNNEKVTGQNGLYATVAMDENKNQLIIKIANVAKEKQLIELNIKGLNVELNDPGKQIILKGDLNIENTLNEPNLIVPEEKNIIITGEKPNLSLEAESFNVFVFELVNEK